MPIRVLSCPHCQQAIEAPDSPAPTALTCPACGQVVAAPASQPPPLPGAAAAPTPPAGEPGAGTLCGVCLSPIVTEESQTHCPACQAAYHTECWQENGGCGVYGCSQVPAVELRQAVEIPMWYWGQENKPCPSCGQQILAAARRCRHCGATFASARPEDAAEFQQRSELTQRLPQLKRTVIWLFLFCLVPCLAPIGAVWGLVWYPRHRAEVEALPSVYPALTKIGLGVAILQTVALVLLGFLYTAVRGS